MAVILVVDDDPAIRRVVRRVLEGVGHRVSECTNGHEALDLFQRVRPDLVITDMHMPGGDGQVLSDGLRRAGLPHPKIIVFSGSGEEDLVAIATAIGAVATLGKPFTRDELLDAVNKVAAA